MQQGKYEKSRMRKCFCFLIYLGVLFLGSFCWVSLKRNRWYSEATICDPQTRTQTLVNTSRLDHLFDFSLERMLYEMPNVLKPPYTVFVKIFIETAEKFFMVGHKVNYYVFTDRIKDIPNITLAEGRQLVILEVSSYQRWQDVSMRRMEMIRDHTIRRFINEVDYLVCVDVDMKFSDEVGVEILSDVFGTLHPGFYGSSREHFTYERRKQSTACIPSDEGDFYYAGGYFGGTVEEVYKLTNFCHNATMTDNGNHIEAVWHDESYLNKYFLYHKPTKVLSPEYLWDNNFGSRDFLKKRRFVAVPKNHDAIRNRRDLYDYSRRQKFHIL
ncbi:histo-blood group ABO system transferase-like isoform X2 [Ranitomeya variabilis]|uniref:histo-blood group ABO system transferase-like isoform X2 n=1 Tax=Ranitomeya variabilis TaxID=490064 RepID=UPI00405663FA